MTAIEGAIMAAARLTNWGMAMLLAELCIARARDRWQKRPLPPTGKPLNVMNPDTVILAGGLLALVQIVAFSLPILQNGVFWLTSHHLPAVDLLLCMWLIGAAQTVMIDTLAYHPRHKMFWCAGWALTSHLFLLGTLWTRTA